MGMRISFGNAVEDVEIVTRTEMQREISDYADVIHANIDTVNTRIDNVHSRVDDEHNRLDAEVAQVNSRIDAMHQTHGFASLSNLDNVNATLQHQVTALQNQLHTLQHQVTTLQNQLRALTVHLNIAGSGPANFVPLGYVTDVLTHIANNKKIPAIKSLREGCSGLGLKEAKDQVEEWMQTLGLPRTIPVDNPVDQTENNPWGIQPGF